MSLILSDQIVPLEVSNCGSVFEKRAWSTNAIIAFFALAFVWSWGIGYAASQIGSRSAVSATALLMVSSFGPSIAALAVVAFFSGRAGLRDWLACCLNHRVGWRWFAYAFLAPPVVMLAALAIHVSLGGEIEALLPADKIPLAIVNFGLVLLVGGPLGEEFGWRGYAMPALMARNDWRTASLVIGVVWGLWHLPLFFMAGTAQSQMPIPVFLLNILAGAVLFGWLFVRSQGSVLPALIAHMSLNSWAGLLHIVPTAATGRPYAIVTALLSAIAIVLLVIPERRGGEAVGL